MATLPSITPSMTSVKNIEARVLKNEFGDGYSQRAADGRNNIVSTWEVIWNGITYTDANTLEAFFNARAGYESFTWTPYRGGEVKKFIVRKWSRAFLGPEIETIKATFEEVFDLSS